MKRSVLLSLGLVVWPALAFAATPGEIRACEAVRAGPGCATLRTQLFVCGQAPDMQGCAALLEMRDFALSEEVEIPEEQIEPDVTPRAEGELADDPSADAASGVSDDGDDGMPDSDPNAATDPADAADTGSADTAPAGQSGDTGATGTDATTMQDATGDCPVIDSADWQASVTRVDGSDAAQLVVTGRVTLPTPSWTVALQAGIADRSARPVQQINLVASPPGGGLSVIQVLTDYDLRLETPALGIVTPDESPYAAIRVMCGAEMVVELTDVSVDLTAQP